MYHTLIFEAPYMPNYQKHDKLGPKCSEVSAMPHLSETIGFNYQFYKTMKFLESQPKI